MPSVGRFGSIADTIKGSLGSAFGKPLTASAAFADGRPTETGKRAATSPHHRLQDGRATLQRWGRSALPKVALRQAERRLEEIELFRLLTAVQKQPRNRAIIEALYGALRNSCR
jgi:hypothetical protein